MRHAAIVFTVALAIRLAYLPVRLSWPDAEFPAVDAAFHDYWAWGLVTGEWGPPGGQIVGEAPGIEARPCFRPPGYPWFLAALYAVAGRSAAVVMGVQAVLGALAAALVVPLGDRLGGRPVGLVAGLLAACTWTAIYFGGELQPPVLVAPLLLGALLLAPSEGLLGRIGAGALLGLAGVAVPNLLAVLPAVALAGSRGMVRRTVAPVLACALVLTAPLARNVRVADAWVPLTTNLGINLYAGNNDAANGWDVAVDGFGTSFAHSAVVERASEAAGRPLSDLEASRWYAGEALTWMSDHPGRVVGLAAKKATLWWHATEVLSNKELNGARTEAWPLALPVGAGVLAALSGGAWVARTSGPTLRLIGSSIGLLLLSYLPFFVNARYRQPVLPLLACLAAASLVTLGRSATLRDWRRVVQGLLGIGLLGVWVHLPGTAPEPELGRWDLAMGVTRARTGDDAGAVHDFDRGIARSPSLVMLHWERGRANLRLGRPAQAGDDLDRAWGLQPSESVALDRLRAHRAAGLPERAARAGREGQAAYLESIGIAWNTHLAQRDAGDLEGAVESLERVVALAPEHIDAWNNLALALGALARDAGPSWLRVAQLHAGAGRWMEAADALSRAGDTPGADILAEQIRARR